MVWPQLLILAYLFALSTFKIDDNPLFTFDKPEKHVQSWEYSQQTYLTQAY